MDMKEKLEKKKMSKTEKTAREKDIQNKEREISEGKITIAEMQVEIENVTAEQEIFARIAKIMLDNYGKVESKIEHKWEEKPEYWKVMKDKQIIDNKRKTAEYNKTLRLYDKKIETAQENIEYLESSIKMDKTELESEKNE